MKKILTLLSGQPKLSGIKFRWHAAAFLFLSFGLLNSATAQSTIWQNTYGGSGVDIFAVAQPTKDGGYILGGYSESDKSNDKSENSRGGRDYWVIKINAQGKKVWDKTIGGSAIDELKAIQQTNDGGYLLGGYSNSGVSGDKTQFSKGGWDYWIVKLNQDGLKVWDKTIGGSGNDQLQTLQLTLDGGFLVGGSSSSGKNGDKSQPNKGLPEENGTVYSDYWIVKFKADGTKEWDKTIGGEGEERLAAIQLTQDGGYILGGSSDSNKSGDKSEDSKGQEDYWIVKLNSNGSKAWDKTVGGNSNDHLTSLKQTSEGGYILGGTSSSEISGDKSEPFIYNFGDPIHDYWAVKVNDKGQKVWDKTVGSFRGDDLAEVVQTKDGGYILAGTSDGDGGDRNEATGSAWLVKLNKTGTKIWEKGIPTGMYLNVTSFQQTRDGNFLLGGWGEQYTNDTYDFNYGVVVLSENQAQTVSLKPVGTKTLSQAPFQLSSKASSGLPVKFRVKSGKARVSNNTLTLTGIGSVTLVAYQPGNNTYAPAEASQTFQVVAAPTQDFRYGGNGTDNLTTFIKTKDGGYLSGGYTNSGVTGDKTQTSRGKNDYWIVKSDEAGKKLWDKRFGGYSDDYLNSIIQTQDGGYLLAGSSFSQQSGDKSQVSRGGRDFWIVKTDAQGNKQWDKRYGGTGDDELKKAIQLPSGRYLLAGSSNSPQSGDKSQNGKGGQDYWILKINPDGQKVWDRNYGGNADDVLEDLALATDGNLLLGGSSASGATGDRTQGSRGQNDFWVLRLDGDGKKVWDQRFGGAQEEKLAALGTTTAGNIYVAGTTASEYSGDRSNLSFGGKDYWLLEIDNSGTKLWDVNLGGSQDEELRVVNLLRNGGYLLAGTSNSGVSGHKTQPSQGGTDYWVVSYTPGLAPQDKRFGGSGEEELRAAVLTQEGYLLAGRSKSGVSGDRTQPSQGSTDYWLVQAGSEIIPAVAARTTTIAPEPVDPLTTFTAYPNPFQEKLTVSFTLPETQAATVRILDNQGREVTTLFQQEAQANQTYQVEWNAGNLVSGMYLLQLQTPTKQQTQKLILTK